MSAVTLGQHSEIIEKLFLRNPHLRPPELTTSYNPGAKTKVLATLRGLPVVNRIVPSDDDRQELIKRLLYEQKTATTYKEWYQVSAQLDELTGNNTWKLTPASPSYDYDLVLQNMMEMRNARLNKDYKLLLYLIRTKWSRNVGNMGDSTLFRQTHVGTKRLIEEYIEECQTALQYLVHNEEVNLDDRYLLGMLVQTRKNIGRTALLLSGGSTFGISHIGVLIALLENNLLPRIISGSSAGSIIASILCCHSNEEIAELLESITERKFSIFGTLLSSDPESKFKQLLERVSHFLKYGTFFDISGVQETIQSFVGDLTFREAYNRTGKILNITVSPASMHEQTRLLNYLTAPHCLIWSAVCASCSLPGIFPSNSIYEKNSRTNETREWNYDQSLKYVDGSVDGDLPIARLSEMFNVDHIIAVQVNPHVSPVLKVSVGSIGGKADSEFANTLRHVINDCYDFVMSEIIHYLQVMHELNIQKNFTSKMISLLTQKYSGDITILPDLNIPDFLKIFSNPTPEFLLNFILKGARASWPKITIINNHCGVEFALDKEISYLRGRLIANANNRITFRNTISGRSAVNMDRLTDSNSYLISNPVLNRDNDLPDTPTKQPRIPNQFVPTIRRHNSIGNGEFMNTNRLAVRKKRSTITSPISSYSPGIMKGKSTTSLQSLGIKSAIDGEELKGQEIRKPLADSYIENFNERNEALKGIRKARSSGNFNFDKRELDSTSLYDFRTSPKYERTIHDAFDYQNFASKLYLSESKPETQRPRVSKEQPNLPKSKPNSLRSSFVGLNRLKDALTRSNDGSANNSKKNSSTNLRDFYNVHESTIKSLNSKDLRRAFSRSKTDKSNKSRMPKVSFSSFKRKNVDLKEMTPEEVAADADSDISVQESSELNLKNDASNEKENEEDPPSEPKEAQKEEDGQPPEPKDAHKAEDAQKAEQDEVNEAAYFPYD